jgi:hypothetical protein
MNPFFIFIKFIYEDLKEDILTLWKIITVKGYLQRGTDRIAEGLKMFNLYEFLTTLWPVIIIIAAFFFAGWYLAAVHYQSVCNQHIYDTFYAPKMMLNQTIFNQILH